MSDINPNAQNEFPTTTLPVDRRVWVRHTCDMEATCSPFAMRRNSDIPWQAKVRDISVGGVSLILKVEPTGLAVWSAALNAGATTGQVVNGITSSQEYRSDVVETAYQLYLAIEQV